MPKIIQKVLDVTKRALKNDVANSAPYGAYIERNAEGYKDNDVFILRHYGTKILVVSLLDNRILDKHITSQSDENAVYTVLNLFVGDMAARKLLG